MSGGFACRTMQTLLPGRFLPPGFVESDVVYGELLVKLECGVQATSSEFTGDADWRYCSACVHDLDWIESLLDGMRSDLRVLGVMLAEASKELAAAQSRKSFRFDKDFEHIASYIKPSSKKTEESLGAIPINLHLGVFSVILSKRTIVLSLENTEHNLKQERQLAERALFA